MAGNIAFSQYSPLMWRMSCCGLWKLTNQNTELLSIAANIQCLLQYFQFSPSLNKINLSNSQYREHFQHCLANIQREILINMFMLHQHSIIHIFFNVFWDVFAVVMEMFCFWLVELSFTADQINDISNWFHGRQLSWQISLHISWQKTLKIKTFCQTEQWNVANDPLLVKVMNFTDDCYTIVGMGDSAIPSLAQGSPHR